LDGFALWLIPRDRDAALERGGNARLGFNLADAANSQGSECGIEGRIGQDPTHRELAPAGETGIFFIQKARGFTTRNTLSARNNDADNDSAG
jgi:hypothetical protein